MRSSSTYLTWALALVLPGLVQGKKKGLFAIFSNEETEDGFPIGIVITVVCLCLCCLCVCLRACTQRGEDPSNGVGGRSFGGQESSGGGGHPKQDLEAQGAPTTTRLDSTETSEISSAASPASPSRATMTNTGNKFSPATAPRARQARLSLGHQSLMSTNTNHKIATTMNVTNPTTGETKKVTMVGTEADRFTKMTPKERMEFAQKKAGFLHDDEVDC